MAKRLRSAKRDSSHIANSRLLSAFSSSPVSLNSSFNDARFFDPDPDPPARDIYSRPARFEVSVTPFHKVHSRSVIARSYYTNAPRGLQVPWGIKFSNPLSVTACIRRKMRRAVMFAMGRTRKGAGARRHKRNSYSNVRC